MKDTIRNMSWNDLLKFLKNNNFEIVYFNTFQNPHDLKECLETEIIFFKNGIVGYANSYHGKINTGKIYFEFIPFEDRIEDSIRKLSLTGCGICPHKLPSSIVFDIDYHIVDGILEKIQYIYTLGNISEIWTETDKFFWFVNYLESKNKNYNYEKINQSKINLCPDYFRNIIGK